jgi:hypothetical protein
MSRWFAYPAGAIAGLALLTWFLRASGDLEPLTGKGAFVPILGVVFLGIAGVPAAILLSHLLKKVGPGYETWRIFAAGVLTGFVGVMGAGYSAGLLITYLKLESLGSFFILAPIILLVIAAVIDLVVCGIIESNVTSRAS